MTEKFKAQAKEYIRDLYTSHRNDDIESWENLIDVLFLYIEHAIEKEMQNHYSLSHETSGEVIDKGETN